MSCNRPTRPLPPGPDGLPPAPPRPTPPRLTPPQVDELLHDLHICLSGADAVDAVTIAHPGLTLVPLDEEQVDPAHPPQVLAALVPTADLGSGGSGSDSGSSSGSDSGSSSESSGSEEVP